MDSTVLTSVVLLRCLYAINLTVLAWLLLDDTTLNKCLASAQALSMGDGKKVCMHLNTEGIQLFIDITCLLALILCCMMRLSKMADA